MLDESILGAAYRAWSDSALCALLGRFWRLLCRLGKDSLLLGLLVGPSRGDALYAQSLSGRAVHRLSELTLRLLRPLSGVLRDSAAGTLARYLSARSAALHFDWLFGCFCCLMFLVPHSYWNNLYALIGALVFLGAWLLLVAGGQREAVYPEALGLGPALFALAVVLSMLFSAERESSLRFVLYFVTALLLCFLVYAVCRDRASLRRMLSFLYLSMLAVSAAAITQRALNLVGVNYHYTDTVLNAGVPGRVFGTLDNPNNLSAFIQMTLPLGAALAAMCRDKRQRLILTLGLALPVVALVMSYSRSGWMAMLAAALVYVYFNERKLVPALVLLGLLALPVLPQSVLTRLSTIFNSADTSTTHRFAIWEGVTAMLADRLYWLSGIGLGPEAFQAVYKFYAVPFGVSGVFHSQMLYLELDVELGLLGVLSFLWMLAKLTGRAGRALGRAREGERRGLMAAVVSGFAALAVSGFAEYMWYYPRCLFACFLFLGIAMAALRLEENELA
ncbi:MAG: O-antigen ligase family protein [Oscillospiraceae bacterium]|nr:O-antigen ligase family protein [Oscillospiraceae bacterium]